MTDAAHEPTVVHTIVSAGPEATALLSQLDGAVFARDGTHVDITPAPGAPSVDLADGPLRGSYVVEWGGQPVGEILVWLSRGLLTSAEYAWYADEPPTAWPAPDQVAIAAP